MLGFALAKEREDYFLPDNVLLHQEEHESLICVLHELQKDLVHQLLPKQPSKKPKQQLKIIKYLLSQVYTLAPVLIL